MTVEEIIERIEPSDGVQSKENLKQTFLAYPELKDDLKEMLTFDDNQEWLKRGEKEVFFFYIYNDSWKHNNSHLQNSVNLIFVEKDKIFPTIAVNIHREPVK